MKIGKIMYAAASFAALLIAGCDGGNGANEQEQPEPEKKTINYSINSSKLFLWADDETNVSITTEGTFDIQSIDNETAKVEVLSERSFKVTAKGPGVTGMKITDEESDEFDFAIFVLENLTRIYRDDAEAFQFIVEVADADTKEAIQDEFGARMVLFYGRSYGFNNEKKTFSVDDHSGTYDFDIYAREMKLMYDGYEDVFIIRTTPEFYRAPLILELDLTEHYQSLYPDSGVSKVFNSRRLYPWTNEFEKYD